jgi:hypothetical protein
MGENAMTVIDSDAIFRNLLLASTALTARVSTRVSDTIIPAVDPLPAVLFSGGCSGDAELPEESGDYTVEVWAQTSKEAAEIANIIKDYLNGIENVFISGVLVYDCITKATDSNDSGLDADTGFNVKSRTYTLSLRKDA